MEKHPNFTERRRFKRRQLNSTVSFCCQDNPGSSDWHLGTIQDASMGGIRVRGKRAVTLHRGQQLLVLCLPNTDCLQCRQEPVRIHGQVAWQDAAKQCFGLQFL